MSGVPSGRLRHSRTGTPSPSPQERYISCELIIGKSQLNVRPTMQSGTESLEKRAMRYHRGNGTVRAERVKRLCVVNLGELDREEREQSCHMSDHPPRAEPVRSSRTFSGLVGLTVFFGLGVLSFCCACFALYLRELI